MQWWKKAKCARQKQPLRYAAHLKERKNGF